MLQPHPGRRDRADRDCGDQEARGRERGRVDMRRGAGAERERDGNERREKQHRGMAG